MGVNGSNTTQPLDRELAGSRTCFRGHLPPRRRPIRLGGGRGRVRRSGCLGPQSFDSRPEGRWQQPASRAPEGSSVPVGTRNMSEGLRAARGLFEDVPKGCSVRTVTLRMTGEGIVWHSM